MFDVPRNVHNLRWAHQFSQNSPMFRIQTVNTFQHKPLFPVHYILDLNNILIRRVCCSKYCSLAQQHTHQPYATQGALLRGRESHAIRRMTGRLKTAEAPPSVTDGAPPRPHRGHAFPSLLCPPGLFPRTDAFERRGKIPPSSRGRQGRLRPLPPISFDRPVPITAQPHRMHSTQEALQFTPSLSHRNIPTFRCKS